MVMIHARDHLGNEYESLRKMYEAYRNTPKIGRCVTYSAFIKRLEMGWTIQECLEGKIKNGKQIVYQKTLYRSIKELCIAMNISAADFRRTIKRLRSVGDTISVCRRLKAKREENRQNTGIEIQNQTAGINSKGQYLLFDGDRNE